ncbi:peptidylprolyl isomerase [Neomegalonema sp.]|uniref:peptidylprolyl isomerase n=1 Tax=Neomegalonema sp. TaxID=2039713 RepID=UPI00261DF09C|nr:peptidylprolyl isomerase [Neomegalonema sp.]MDD2867943.1 peptidylprolyl isomerase [Neomegalonema sp.]
MFKRPFAFAALALAFAVAPWAAAPLGAQTQEIVVSEAQSEDVLVLKLKDGDVLIRLRPDLAPNHVARIKELVAEGFYDGIVFHRVIPGFMAQTGDPTGTGAGGSGRKLRAEFSSEPFRRGTVGMARSASPDSADSQFFICFDDAPHLNRQYTVWGEVISGMEFVDKIKKGSGGGGTVADPDKMISLRAQGAN